MLQIEKEHKRSTLMSSKKEDLVNQIMYLEHNNNVLNNTLNQQAENFKTLEKEREFVKVVYCVMDGEDKVFAIYETSKRAEIIADQMKVKYGKHYYVATWQVH